MSFPFPNVLEPVMPTAAETELAVESSRRLAPYFFAKDALRVQVMKETGPGKDVELPAAAVRLLVRILTEMAQGNAVKLVPIHAELTTEQAAELIDVPHQYLGKLLDEGRIPYCTAGQNRRVRFNDLMAYKKQNDLDRLKALDELTALGQEMNMGY